MSKFADALAAGYSKQEIVAFLRDRQGYDARINEALSSGYSEDEIVDHLHRQEFKAINPSATDEDLNYLVNDSIKTARKPRQTEAENIEERVQNRMKAGSSRAGAEQATVFDLNLEEKLRQRRNGLDASVRGDIGALGMEQNQKWRDANQKLRQDAGRERTWGEAAQDVGVQLLEGGQNISGAIPDLVAPDSEWAQFHKKAANFWNSKQSEPIKARAQLAGQAIGQAGEDGVIAQVVEAASQYWDDPVLASRFVVTNLPSMVPGIAAAKLAQAGALARGATAARAMTAGVVAAGGVNAGLNAGGARGEAFEDIKQTLIKQGMDERQANEIAKRESIVPAMVGGVTGAFSGSTGLERAFAGGIGRPLMATGAELLGEQAEEVLPKLTTNLVAGRYDGRSPGQDVGRTMVETAIGSAPGAVLAGGMEALGSETPDGISRKGGTHGGIGSGQRSIDDDVSGQFKDDTQSGVQPTQAATSRTGPVYPPAEITERPLAQLSEFEQFIQAEREDISRRRVGMVERQAASQQAEIEQRIPSEVETKDAQVLAARQRTDQEQRLADLEHAMRSPNPMATFAELRTSKNQPVLPEDSAILKRRMGQAEAFQGDYAPGVEPSLPDGGMSDMVPERKPVAQSAPAGGNFAAIDNALANGFKPQGKALVHPKTGKKINLNVAEREYLAGLKRGGNQPVTSPGAEDGDTDQGGQVSQVASRGVEGASAELPGSGRATQAGVSGGLPGDGGRAAVPGGSDGSPVPAGTAGAQGVNEFDVSTRTDEQLANLVKAGKPGWREAAIAEVSKRSKENAASTDDGQAASVDAAAHQAATSPHNGLAEPSEGQKKAGNYAKGHTRVAGLDLSIENPEGSTRSGTDPDGKPWSVTMKSHYGYIKGTVGKDKDHIDVFVKPGTAEDWSGTAFVVDQVRPDTGAFDEHKIMLGFADIDEAKAAYRENYAKGWAGLKTISATPMQELKDWIKDGDTTKPFHKAKLKAEVEKAKKKPLDATKPATSTETPAGQPAATTKKAAQAKRRETERALFVSAVSSESIQDMATANNTAEQFMLGAEKVIEGLLVDQGVEAVASLMQDGKLTIEKAFYESVRKSAIKAREEAEKAKNRDPMVYQSALEAAQSEKAETEGAKALFKAGFDHALKGMTKSTLTSDDLGFKADGYEAARKWMKTEQGRAWYEGKPLKREESTGEALRRHWEMMRKGLDKITADDSKKAWERIQRNTVRADLLPSDTLAPDATGGAQRWFADFRNQVGSFKDYFMASLGTRNSARKYFNADAVWAGTYTVGNSGPFSYGSGASAQERLNKALEIARAYQDDLGEIANLLRGKKSLAEIKAVIDGDLEKKFPHVFKQSRWNSGRDLEGVLNSENYGWKNRVEGEGREFKQPDRSKPLVRPRLDKIIRTGLTDHRRGKDVGAQEFKKTFGFADVTIGEYVTAQQAKDHLNYAFDAFMDLADVLGIRPVDISFGGQMHFAIGALGHGKHSAHFSPDHPRPDGGIVPVINLTNTRGDGAVAHEWGHALDYFSGSMDAKPSSHDNAARVVIRGIKALLKRTPHTKENGEAIARSFLRGGRFYPHIGMSSPPKKHAEYALRHGYRSERYGTTTTDYLAEALKLDGLKSTGSENAYWSNDNEPLARAFEAFVFDQLKARGARNDYLVTDWVEDGKVGPQQGYRAFPYPRGAERTGFNAMFKDFAKGLGFKDGRPGVAEDTLNAKNGGPYRQRTDERDAAYDEVIGRLDEIAEEMRKEQDDKKRAEQEERDRLLFGDPEADAEENNQPPLATQDQAPTQDENAPLSDDELSALFDEAAAELAESTQEQPEAPAPGEPTQPKGDTLTLEDVDTLLSMLDETRRDGIAIGGTIPGIPSIHDIGALGKTEHMGYGSFETVGFGDHPNAPGRTEEWRMVWEGGGAMKTLPSGLSYTRVRISGKAASPYPFQQVRQALERMQSRDKLATEVAKARARTTQEAGEALFSGRGGKLPSTAEQNAKIAAELAKEAAKLGVQGIDSALAGLVELFGGSKIKSFPAGFDEEAYAKAKPHFEKALAQFIEAGKTLKDLFKFLIQNFGMGIKPYAMQFAKEKGLASTLGETKQEPDTKQDQTGTPSERLATWVRLRILRRQPITWQELFLMADSEFGGTQAQGVYTPKDAYDAVELGVNQHIIETMPFTDLQHGEIGAVSIIRAYQDVLAMLPTQTKRTAEMDEFQQFSTPPTYAYLANWVANVKAGETFLEPSAGIGGLAVFGKVAGAKVVVNELSARRLAVLKTLPFDHFFAENAEHLASILPQELRPTVVVMNPPFSATAGRVQGERDTMNGAKHIEQALKYMQEGGRLVAIVGEGMAMDRPAFREWWNKIRQQYNVRANLGIDGSGYAKYGTTFDNQILVIDKTGPTTGEIVTGKVQSPADAVGLLEKVREDRQHRIEATQPPASPSGERAGGETVADGGQSTRPGVSSQPASGADSTAGVGGGKPQRPGSGSSRGGAARPDAPRDGSGPVGEGGRSSPGRGQQPAATDGSQDGQGGVRGDPQPGQDGGGVTLEQVEDRPQADFTNAVFEQYTPKKLKISGAKPHNTPLVESSALATVSPPNPTYTPNLPKELIESGALSDAQLEVVVYAGQAHEQFLENEQRRGFFVGDGTGVGKGREISGIIMDNLRRGRKKAVWISQKKELMEDAKRDFGDIGGDPKIIFGQHKMKGDAAIAQADGILFSTYSLIKGDTKATKDAQKAANVMVGMGGAAAKVGKAMKATLRDRTKQIVNWLGEDFDGVIVFDEAHNMGNAVAMKGERGNKEPSEQALAAVALQNALPKARIVYVSATGATEVSNLAYATRLGLWGAGTPFANVGAFVSAMSTSVSAMELVAQNLKQMGLYFSRSLSFDGGTPETRVTYDRLEHALDPYQHDVYNALAQAWQTVLNNIDKALDMTGVNDNGKPAAGGASGKKKGAILSAFWGSHQRFFNQVITALQMPSVIAAVNQDLADGYAVVMQIVNTNEADQNRALAKLGGQTVAADDGEANEIEELDLTPREQLITFLEKAFPVQKMEVVQTTNPDGSVTKSLNPVVDSEGKPVFDADAMALRQETIDMVRQITIPDAPLQMVINEFGPDRVAEITGRGERVIYDENGKLKTEKRGAHAAANDAQAFKDGKKDILIFSNAGGTGFSFHADRRYKNQKRRKHYVIQPGWSADKVIQGLGRSHRTNQKTAPQHVLVTTDVPAQKRFISTIARRLESMGALTMGQRDTAGGTMFKASDNLESKYATRAVEQFFDNLIASRYAELPAFMEVLKQMGLEKAFDPQTRGANKDGIPSVRQFLNRILSVSLEMQETMMTLFTEEIESQVELAKSMGAFDDGLKTVHHVGATVKREEVINQDERSGAETKFYEIDYKTPNDFYDFDKADKEIKAASKGGWFKNKKSGHVIGLLARNTTRTDKYGQVHRLFGVRRTSGNTSMIEPEIKYDTLDKLKTDEARALWEAENEKRAETVDNKLNMVVGAILPLWDRFTGEHVNVSRIRLDDGRKLLGRVILPKDVETTLANLNIKTAEALMTGSDLVRAVLDGKKVVFSNQWTAIPVTVSNEKRVEITGAYGRQPNFMPGEAQDIGIIQERIGWQERYFIPSDVERGGKVLDALMRKKAFNATKVGRDEQTKFSRNSGAGINIRDAKAVVDAFRQANRNAPTITVLEDVKKAPNALLEKIRKAGAMDDVEGAFHEGIIYVFPQNLESIERAAAVLVHEGRHFAFAATKGRALDAILLDIYNTNDRVRMATRKKKSAIGLESTVEAVEEVLADLDIDTLRGLKGWKALVAHVRLKLREFAVTLRRAGLPKVASWLQDRLNGWTDADVAAMLKNSDRFVRSGRGDGSGGTRMSRTADTIEVDGVVRPTTNSKGQRIAQTEEGLRAFYKWFGDSKVVDEQGRPLVVYHGTAKDFTEFDLSKSGESTGNTGFYGAGAYFSEDGEDAGGYALWARKADDDAANVIPAYLALKEPLYLHINPKDDAKKDKARASLGRIVDQLLSEGYFGKNPDKNEAGSLYARLTAFVDKADFERFMGTLYNELKGGEGVSNLARRAGFDGVMAEGFKRGENFLAEAVAFDPTQIKSATGNRGTFDPTNPDIRFSRATGNGTLRAKRGPIDTPLRIATQRLGADKLTGGAWEGLQRIAGAYVPEVVKAGMVDDYGISAGYTDARSMMFSHQRQGLRGVQRLMDRVAGLSRAESAVLYQAAAYEADPGKVYSMLAGLPEESRAVLKEIKQLVHDLGEEEVMLGLLDSETFERNEWAYLHRSYARWELGLSDQEKVARQKAKSIWGDTFRMRGMKMDINPESIHAPAPWFNGEMKGKKVTVLKKARADGKFSRAMVVGAIPEKYSTWTVDGDWEIIDAKKGNFVVRRDYTPDERQDMGEIEDIRFATVKTLQHMMHNVEVAKFFEWVAATEAADEVPEGGIIADPSESLTRAYKKDEWVLVPDSKLTGTSVKRYGSLAGKYVQGPVWNDIRQLANRHYAPFGKTYAAILKAWKISKTALSPAVHMNNVMANLVMADWHDVEATHLLAAIKAMANDDRALIDAFEDNGGSEGMYAISELQREQLQPIIDALEEELAGAIQGEGMVGAIAAVRILHDARLADLLKTTGPWREAWEAFRLGKAYKVPAKLAGKMIDLYQEEDTVFRLAAFIKAKEDGLTDKEAGKFARKSFLDYQINAPWIQAMRNTAFPFISFTYRALPMLLDTAAHKPWKLLKLGLTMGALNALFTAMAGGDDDEDRKYLPVEKSGRVLGFVAPKLIRMPWNGEHDAPVFLDIRRWIPVGDIVDIGQEHSAIPLLPSMMPGGPLVVLGEVVFNTSAFTGKKITKSTDTGLSDALGHGDLSMERYVKVVDHLYKAFMPNIMGLPGTYATAKVADAATGKTDSFGREYSTASAMASGFGVKVAAYPKDVGKLSNDLDYLAKEREIADNIRSLERQKKRKGISREEYRDALKQEMEKLRRAEEERAQ